MILHSGFYSHNLSFTRVAWQCWNFWAPSSPLPPRTQVNQNIGKVTDDEDKDTKGQWQGHTRTRKRMSQTWNIRKAIDDKDKDTQGQGWQGHMWIRTLEKVTDNFTQAALHWPARSWTQLPYSTRSAMIACFASKHLLLPKNITFQNKWYKHQITFL